MIVDLLPEAKSELLDAVVAHRLDQRTVPTGLENKRFCAMADPKCDGRVNLRGMWGHVGLCRDTSVGEIPVDLAALFQGI
jgi:hypothetical protein